MSKPSIKGIAEADRNSKGQESVSFYIRGSLNQAFMLFCREGKTT
jgi:hypothetical protein